MHAHVAREMTEKVRLVTFPSLMERLYAEIETHAQAGFASVLVDWFEFELLGAATGELRLKGYKAAYDDITGQLRVSW